MIWFPETMPEDLNSFEWFALYDKQQKQSFDILGEKMKKMQDKIVRRKKEKLPVARWLAAARIYRTARNHLSSGRVGRLTRDFVHGFYWEEKMEEWRQESLTIEIDRLQIIYNKY